MTLANSGTIGVAGTFTPTATFTTGGYVIAGSTVNFDGASQSVPAFNYNNLTISGSGTTTLASSGTIGVAGTFTPGGGAFTNTGSTVNFNGANQTVPAFNYNNLTVSGSGTTTLASSGTIGVAGTFTPGGGAFTITGSTVNFDGTGAQTVPAFNYNNLTSSSSGARTLASSGTIGVAGTFTPGTNTYTSTGSTVNFDGSTAQTVPVATSNLNFNNLELNNTSGATLNAAITTTNVTGNVQVQSGTLNNGGFAIAGNATMTFSVAANPTFILSGTTSAFPTGFGTVTLDPASTVNYTGSGTQTIAAQSYGNLTSSNTARILASSGTIGIAGTFTPGTAAYTSTGSTVNFDGTTAQTVPEPSGGYNNLTISGAYTGTNSVTLVNGGTIGVAGTFSATATFTTGGYVITGNTVNFDGTGAQRFRRSTTTTCYQRRGHRRTT